MRKVEYDDMKEREISLIDLLVDILLHWRMFFVWMLIGAVLLGAFSFNRSRDTINSQKVQAERNPEDGLSQQEIQNVKYLISYEKAYFSKGDYLEKSLLMGIDPNSVSEAEATITIIADDYQKSCNIKKAYKEIVQSGELVTKIAEDTGMDTIDIEEMVFIDKDLLSRRLTADRGNDSVNVNGDTNIFKIVTRHNEEAQCKAMLDIVLAFLKEKQPDVKSAFGEHEITVINESFGVVSDGNIAQMQKAMLDEMTNMKRVVSDTKVNLSDGEREYYDFLMKGEGEETTEELISQPEPVTPHISIKYVVLGALIAAFFYAMVLFVGYIFNTKVRATDNLQELYDIPQLGMIPAEKEDKRLLSFVDKWILSIRSWNKRQFTPGEALELTAVAAKMSAGKEAIEKICLIGCGVKEGSLNVCEEIKHRLAKDNIQVDILNNVLYDAKMMEELESAKGVILLESIGSTLYNEIAAELEILKRQKIKVLGGILVE